MFTWLNKQGVRSDQGFELQFTGRFSAEYREGKRLVTLDVEDGLNGGLPCIIVDPDAFSHWDGDPAHARISEADQQRMIQNLREALEFQGLKLVIERGYSPHN